MPGFRPRAHSLLQKASLHHLLLPSPVGVPELASAPPRPASPRSLGALQQYPQGKALPIHHHHHHRAPLPPADESHLLPLLAGTKVASKKALSHRSFPPSSTEKGPHDPLLPAPSAAGGTGSCSHIPEVNPATGTRSSTPTRCLPQSTDHQPASSPRGFCGESTGVMRAPCSSLSIPSHAGILPLVSPRVENKGAPPVHNFGMTSRLIPVACFAGSSAVGVYQ
jgi:hypothetical protein